VFVKIPREAHALIREEIRRRRRETGANWTYGAIVLESCREAYGSSDGDAPEPE
jgi:hypothetical protein